MTIVRCLFLFIFSGVLCFGASWQKIGSTTTTNTTPTTGLIVEYKLDGNTNDTSGVYNGAATNNIAYVLGRFGQAAAFSSTNSAISASTPNKPILTRVLWFKLNTNSDCRITGINGNVTFVS